MKVSYNWLRELTGTGAGPRELAQRLTMVGLAVDAVEEAGDDFVIEIDLTSNRPDCLSHLGVAREICVAERRRVRLPPAQPLSVAERTSSFASVEIDDPELCPRYTARVVRGVRIGPSPDWMAARLKAVGQRPVNNVADITNYVMHELGQPLHAFDLAKLPQGRIIVRRARAGEKIKTLDGVERQLDEEMLVIADPERAIALAGIMGGEESEISAATRDVLIECAYFNPDSVRRTARLLGMQTDASYRFERGTDYANLLRAQDRTVALICEIAGGTATADTLDLYPRKIEPPRVRLRPSRVARLTGLQAPVPEILRILGALGFEQQAREEATSLSPDQNEAIEFVAPTWRVDIEREEDLVEEVARHLGYEKIETRLPASALAGEYQPNEPRRRAARRALAALGFDEAISFSFIDTACDDLFDLIPDLALQSDDGERFIALRNPIIEGAARLRPTLLAGLLNAVRHNFNYGTRDVRLFELGRVFAAGEPRPVEREALALVGTGGALEAGRAAAARELDFYDVKGALEAVADQMGLAPLGFEAASVKHLREGQAAVVRLGHKTIGTIGRLSDQVAALFKFRQPVYVAEVDLNALEGAETGLVRYRPLARFPAVSRDVSMLVARSVTLAAMIEAVRRLGLSCLRDVALVDVYEGTNVPEDKRSITLRMEYRADDRTLRDDEVDEMHAQVVRSLEAGFGAQLRQ
jgi:phenylalanyl-tRNA synthetase beta chain